MINKVILLAIISLFIFACKPTQTINLPEHVIEINNPKTVPTQEIYQASKTREFDLIHTKLDVKFNLDKSYLYGKAELTLRPYFYSTDKLVLNARGQEIHKVQLVKDKSVVDLKYTYDGLLISIALDKVYSRSELVKIVIDYTAKPEELPEKGSDAIKSDKGLFFINPKGEEKNKPTQIWTQGETESNQVWFPTIDAPNERCTGEISITVEEKYKTLSNGILMRQEINGNGTRTDVWEMDQPHAPYLFMMAIGEYAVVKDKWENIDVDYYVEPEFEKDAKAIFGLTPEMISFFSNKLGVKYPWKKYSQVVVRDYVSGAMENTTAVVFGDFVQNKSRELIDENIAEDIISHELFHHWFGDLVTCESWSNLPLNESFATYGEYLWKEYKHGRDYADYGLMNDWHAYMNESEESKVDLVRFNYRTREDMFDAHSYQKGGLVLHMLRNYLGDDAFFASLKQYLNKHEYTDVEMHEFRLACEDISGKDLNWFFNQWFYASGHPQLNVTYFYDDSSKTQIVNVEQIQDFTTIPLYKLPIKIDIYAGGKVQRHLVNADEAVNSFVFDVPAKPDLVKFDADNILLCEKYDNKTDSSEWAFMYNHAPMFLDRYLALSYLKLVNEKFAYDVILKAISDSSHIIRSFALQSIKSEIIAYSPGIKDKLIDIAKNDPKTIVRADAIETLTLFFPGDEGVKQLLKDGLNEQSYAIVANSLRGVVLVDPALGLKKAEEMQFENNHRISKVIAEIFEFYGGKEHFDYFKQKFSTAEQYEKYSLITSFGNYLKNQDNDVVLESISILDTMATSEGLWWNRMAGLNVVATMENIYYSRVVATDEELRKDTENATLKEKQQQNRQIQQQLMAIIEKAKATEQHPTLKKMLGINQ